MPRRLWTRRSPEGWLVLVAPTTLLLVCLWWNALELRSTWSYVDAAFVSPTRGRVVITDCDDDSRNRGSWACHGPFISDDGKVVIESTTVQMGFDTFPGSVIPAAADRNGRVWTDGWSRFGHHLIAGFATLLVWVLFTVAAGYDRDRAFLRGNRREK